MPTPSPNRQFSSPWETLAQLVSETRGLGWFFFALGLLAIGSLSLLQFEFSPQTLFDENSDRARIYHEYRAEFGADDHVIMVLLEADLRQIKTWEQLKAIEENVRSEVEAAERVDGLFSLPLPQSDKAGTILLDPWVTSLPQSQEEATALLERSLKHPLLARLFVSEDGTAAAVLIKIEDEIARLSEVRPVVSKLRKIADQIEELQPGTSVHLLGPHTYRVAVVGIMISEELRFLPLTGVILGLALFILFRRLSGVLVPLLSVFLGALWTLAVMALTGEAVNIINTITATLILVIGVADAIHMMTRYAQERGGGSDRNQATRIALHSVGSACFLTSLTTAVGFLTLGTARLEILRHFGLYAAIGVGLTFGMTMVFVPWALVRWKQEPLPLVSDQERASLPLNRLLAAVSRFVCRFPRRTVVFSLLVIVLVCAGAKNTRVDNFIMEYVPRDDALLQAHQLLEEKLAGIVFIDTLLEFPDDAPEGAWLEPDTLRRAAALEEAFRAEDGIHNVDSILTLLRELRFVQGQTSDAQEADAPGESRRSLPQSRAEAAQLLLLAELGNAPSLETHWRSDGRFLRMTARAADLGARNYLALEERMHEAADRIFSESKQTPSVVITGTSQVGYGGIDSLIRDLLTSLGWAFLIIFLTLCVLFRSVPLAGLAMIPNLAPVLCVLGALGWASRHLETLSAMVFSIGLGIAVDDTIHFLARYCDEVRNGRSPEEAVEVTIRQTGRAIVHTSVLLLLGFGVLLTSSFPPNQSFALLAGGVIGTAVLADLTLLPGLLLWLRPSIPPGWSKKIHPRKGQEPSNLEK